jgi:hypothetical protein
MVSLAKIKLEHDLSTKSVDKKNCVTLLFALGSLPITPFYFYLLSVG